MKTCVVCGELVTIGRMTKTVYHKNPEPKTHAAALACPHGLRPGPKADGTRIHQTTTLWSKHNKKSGAWEPCETQG